MYDVRICPKCKGKKIKVVDAGRDAFLMTRRRECQECGYRFNTVELCDALAMDLRPRKEEN